MMMGKRLGPLSYIASGTETDIDDITLEVLADDARFPLNSKIYVSIAREGVVAPTPPAGWDLELQDTVSAPGLWIYSHVVVDRLAHSYLFAFAAPKGSGWMTWFTVANVLAVTYGTPLRAASGTSIVASSITPTKPGILFGIFATSADVGYSSTPPAGMSRIQRALLDGAQFLTKATTLPSPAGATGTKTMVADVSGPHVGLLMQVTQ